MNAVVPCFYGLDGHYRRVDQALARGEGNQGAVQRRLSGGHQQKGAERDEPTKKHRVAFVFLFQKPLGIRYLDLCTADKSGRHKGGLA